MRISDWSSDVCSSDLLGLVLASGVDRDRAVAALAQLSGVPGRVELVGATTSGGHVYVDYAHTPDALETVLKALRTHTQNQLFVIIGCGGDCDRGKRTIMGSIAATLDDRAVTTDAKTRTQGHAPLHDARASCGESRDK